MIHASSDPCAEGAPGSLSPTELPLRSLCPECGSTRVTLMTALRVSFEVVSAIGAAGDLQVLRHQLEGCGWEDDDPAQCPRCGWRGPASTLREPA